MNEIKIINFEKKFEDSFYNLILDMKDYFTDYSIEEPTIEEVVEEFVDDLPPGLSIDDKDFLLIYYKGNLVGFIDIVYGYPAKDTAMLGWLVLHKDYRNKGLGKKLLNEIENIVFQKGYNKLELTVVTSSKATKFWEKCLFEEVGRISGPYGEQINMRKTL